MLTNRRQGSELTQAARVQARVDGQAHIRQAAVLEGLFEILAQKELSPLWDPVLCGTPGLLRAGLPWATLHLARPSGRHAVIWESARDLVRITLEVV